MALHPHTHFDTHALVLHEPEPAAALADAVAKEIRYYGVDRGYVMEILDAQRRGFRDAGNRAAADAVIEVMERLDGWCAPEARL